MFKGVFIAYCTLLVIYVIAIVILCYTLISVVKVGVEHAEQQYINTIEGGLR